MARIWVVLVSVGVLLIAGYSSRPTGAKTSPAGEAGPQRARGKVFHDLNANGKFDAGEPALPGVKVSNGREIVATDGNGGYELPVTDDTILFVLKPRGWRTPVDEMKLPRFYYIHKPNGSPPVRFGGVAPTGPLPDSVDFPLYPQVEPNAFHALFFGDTQPRNIKEVEFIGHDIVEELVGTDASFGVTLGDIVFDDLSMFEPQARMIALLGIPWYNVIGNHDINYDAKVRKHANETYERVFGPSYYSFDYGPVHFLALDDIKWFINDKGEGEYIGGLGPEQMEFIRKDLELIPKDQLVVLMMHIPLYDVEDRHELFRLIEQRPFSLSLSAHEHVHHHRFITDKDGWKGPEPHHHVVTVTACGSWWGGAPDERGIPHSLMRDGAPNGYAILSFDGQKYSIDFKAASFPKEYQMEIHAPEEVSAADAGRTVVYANVFNGSEKSTVELKIGEGQWTKMEQTREFDPKYLATFLTEAQVRGDNIQGKKEQQEFWTALPKPEESDHLWKATLPAGISAGTHFLEVRTTDMHGRTYQGRRILRVRP